MPPIRGRFPVAQRQAPQKSLLDLSQVFGDTNSLIRELKQLKADILNQTNSKLKEIDAKLNKHLQNITDTTQILKNTQNQVIDYAQRVKQGAQGKPGKDATDEALKQIKAHLESKIPPQVDTKALEASILAKVPKIDEKTLTQKILKAIPGNKASLKIIQEQFVTDPMSVIDKILELSKQGKFKLKQENIDGLSQTIAAFRHQITTKGYLHGGGTTVVAGTNITLVPNANGTTTINASGGGGGGAVASETPTPSVDGSTTIFTVVNTPLFVIADGQLMTNGNGFSLSGLTLTFTNAPQYFLQSFYSTGSFAAETPTPAVDKATTVFSVANTPVFIIADGQGMTNGNGFTYSSGTITFTNPPQYFIISFHN